MFCYALLYLYCLVTLIISTFAEISEESKMIHHHRLSDVTPTTSSKKDATTTIDAADEDTSADDATVEEEFFDIDYDHHFWLFMNSLEQQSIILKQKYVQFYVGKYIHPALGMVSCAYHMITSYELDDLVSIHMYT